MALIKSMEDLANARIEALERKRVVDTHTNFHIHIGTASCGIAAGAADTLKTLNGLVASHKLTSIHISQTGCIGLCALEPIVQVQAPNQAPVTYGKVTPQIARRIIQEHIINGIIVHEHVVENI